LGRDDLAVPELQASLQFMRDFEHYEEMIRALTALGACMLRQGQFAEARACLGEAYELSLTQHLPWQRSEVCYRLGKLVLAETQLDEAAGEWDEADDWARRAQEAISQGGSPDWLGPIQLLLARATRRRVASASQIASCYQKAASLAKARCRAVERARVLLEAGRYLAIHADADGRADARGLTRQAEEWLTARGIPY
jgi:tetratricopeptide (TPR) repeat protein